MKLLLLLSLMLFGISTSYSQQNAKIDLIGKVILPPGQVFDSYSLDMSMYASNPSKIETIYGGCWRKYQFVTYTIDTNNKIVTFILNKNGNRSNWTIENWNSYFQNI